MRPPLLTLDCCLFLDFDGTLIELTDSPYDVEVDAYLRTLLRDAAEKLGGALALVSGRRIALLDELVAPLKLPTSGLHGVERRDASGSAQGDYATDLTLDTARARMSRFVDAHPGTLLEDKGRTLGLHFRMAPQYESAAHDLVHDIARQLDGRFHVQAGNMLFEVKPHGVSKGTAIAEFMREAPFAGRRPVFLGDDITDRDGFAAVERHGGMAVAVGDRVQARYTLQDSTAVRAWLRDFVAPRD